MNREIKFRVWYGEGLIGHGKMDYYPPYGEIYFDDLDERIFWMEYTGIKDKNGKEIYEGDIVKVISHWMNSKPPQILKVEFSEGVFGVKGFYDHEKSMIKISPNSLITEVIGNIYENQELIK